MGGRPRVEFDGAEQAVQPPEVLILQPARARILVAGDRQHVAFHLDSVRHVELAGREGVLGVANERTVEPHVDGCGCALEGKRHRAPLAHGLGDFAIRVELAPVDRHMAVLGDGRSLRVLMSVPWVLHVHVLRGKQPRSLQMRGHLHAGERRIVEVGRGEQRRHVARPIGETARRRRLDADPPFAVKALPEIRTLAVDGGVRPARMIGMGVEPVDRVHARVREPCRCRHGR